MNTENNTPEGFIRRPDGSYVELTKLEPRDLLAHELVEQVFPMAEFAEDKLRELKRLGLTELRAHHQMMMEDHGVRLSGKAGGFSLRNIQGTRRVALEVSKNVYFGPEISAAKELIDEFIENKLEGSTDEIKVIMEKIFKINSQGRLDTAGILGLKTYGFQDPLWQRAMDLIDKALIDDDGTTYLRFYRISLETKTETMIPLNIAKVESAA